jgi:hypothetical protein
MRLKIANPIDRDFGMVPRDLWAMQLPFQAKGLAAYLFCLRDGSVPYVAEIETALGIGRDARRKAFAALEAAGLIEWHVEIERGRIIGKTLLLHPLRCCAPENQADGLEAGESPRAPDFPADGKHVSQSTETRPSGDCGSGDTLKDKKERARKAREAAAPRATASRAPVARPTVGGSARPFSLTPFQVARLLSGQSIQIDGKPCLPGSPTFEAMRQAARAQDAMKRGVA